MTRFATLLVLVPVVCLAALAPACGNANGASGGVGSGGNDGSVPGFGGLRSIQGGKNRIALAWDAADPPDSVTYAVFRRRADGQYDFSASLARTGALAYVDTSIATDTDYFYVVRATRDGVRFDDNLLERSAYAVAVAFPEDDGPHDNDVEWWYYTGHLGSGQGDSWGFELTFFKVETGTLTVYLGNFAITDHRRGTFVFAENPGLNERQHPPGGFDIKVGSWILYGGSGEDHIEASHHDPAQGLTYSLTIDLSALKGPVLQGRDGITGEASEFPSYYYSRTRMAVSGVLDDGGTEHTVSGTAWMDHQWLDEGTDSGLGAIDGWDWFSIQLENGVDLMLTEVRLDSGGLAYAEGTWILADGSYQRLDMSQVFIESVGSWTSPASGNTYPSGWTIAIPDRDLTMTIEPILADQELWGLTYTPMVYWEGEVTVTALIGGSAVPAQGYVELTGYDD